MKPPTVGDEHLAEHRVENMVDLLDAGESRARVAARLGIVESTVDVTLARNAVHVARYRARRDRDPGEHEHEWRTVAGATATFEGDTSTLLDCRWPYCTEIRYAIDTGAGPVRDA